MTNYRVVAVNSDDDQCSCCGRKKLAKVVWIENLETGEVDCFGRVCALRPERCFGLDREIDAAFSAYERNRKTEKAQAEKAARKAERLAAKLAPKTPEKLAFEAKFEACVAEARSTFNGDPYSVKNMQAWIQHLRVYKQKHGC